MSNTLHGNPGLRILPGATISVARDGLLTGSVTYEVIKENLGMLPRRGSFHPFYPGMVMGDSEINIGECYARLTGRYFGADTDGDETERVYSLSIGMGQEPIETHPNFRQIAGTPASPKNGALFVDQDGNPILKEGAELDGGTSLDGAGDVLKVKNKGRYLEPATSLNPTPEAEEPVKFIVATFDKFVKGDLSGVSSYLDANNVIWRESYTTTKGVPDARASRIGRIDTPPGPVPNFSPRNWLYVGMNLEMRTSYRSNVNGKEERRNVYSVSMEWRLSGRRGWNRKIYND